jgi:anti-sigma B factor antagonist
VEPDEVTGITLSVTSNGSRDVLRVSGEIDISNVEPLKAELQRPHQPQVLVLNLTSVTFIDSSGIAAIVAGMHAQRANGGVLILVCPATNRRVRRVLDIVGLSEIVPIVESEPVTDRPSD